MGLPRPRLYLGDCLQRLRDVQDASVDMVFADLPYGVTANPWDTPIDLDALWAHLLRVGKPACAFIFTASQPFATTLINSQPKMFRYDLIWDKGRGSNFFLAKHRPFAAHECIILFGRNFCYVPQMTPGSAYTAKQGGQSDNYKNTDKGVVTKSCGHRFPLSIIRVSRPTRTMHPTQKPVDLLKWLVRTYTNPGDLVLDPTMGSGTTGVACAGTSRRFIGIEQDPGYFDTACRRIPGASG